MLMIRLQRFGRKNDPNFRVVLTDKRNAPKSGKFLEILGFQNPKTKQKKLEAERIKYWIGKGAKVSPTVHNLLISEKIIEGTKINVIPAPKAVPELEKQEEKPIEKSEVQVDKVEEVKEEAPPTHEVVGAPTESVGVDNQQK